MDNFTTDLTITLPPEIWEAEDLNTQVDYIIENDGIGSYEFWGQQCFDEGESYVSIQDITPDYEEYEDVTEEDKARIERYIDDNFTALADKYADDVEPPEGPDYDDRDE